MIKKSSLRTFVVMVGVITLMTSCQAIKSFLNTELSDEDFIIGELYADDYVQEKPHIPRRTANFNGNTSKTGIELNSKDNKDLFAAIDSWFGTPYLYGGCSKEGVDCSCFVGHIYKEVYNISLHRTAADIQKDVELIDPTELKEGDIIFFTNSNGKVSHVGIYLKEDMFVHSSTSNGVIISKTTNNYWSKHIYKGGRHKKVTTRY